QIRLDIDGVRLLLVHGSPRKINEYLLLDRSESQLARLAVDADAEVVLHGHIHIPYHRSFDAGESGRDGAAGTLHYVSSGSVGKPKDGDPRAGWVEVVLGTQAEVLDAAPDDSAIAPAGETGTWVGMVVHRLDYDIEAVAAEMLEAGLPATLGDSLRSA
ncbi:MAG: metallophosphoesterase family protein, partial [Actinomycetota bacterium]|nr:metallophosphoesterase family protein [Actinomycetota bacterium]